VQLIRHTLSNKIEVKLNGYSVTVCPRELLRQNRLANHIINSHCNRQDTALYLQAFASVLAPMPPEQWARLIRVFLANAQTVD
jgi:hypothetical protein